MVIAVGVAAHVSAGSRATPACSPSWRAFARPAGLDLADVAALSPTDVWAVGWTGSRSAERPRIVHWDGRRLRIAPAFRPSVVHTWYRGKSLSGSLSGIAAISSQDIWAVGTDGVFGSGVFSRVRYSRPVIEHWNGSVWRVVPTPRLSAGGSLNDVSALSRTDVWAVGQVGTRPLYEHWDGNRWRAIVGDREGALSAVDGTSSRNVWAVGAQGLTSRTIHDLRGLAMRWNGTRWNEIRDPDDVGDEGGTVIHGVDVLSATGVWDVRADYPTRWDGRRWRGFAVSNEPAHVDYEDIAAVGPDDVWGVGGGNFPVIVHWDGHVWKLRQTPFDRYQGSLNRLSVVSPSEIWAAGLHLLARYSCG